jgi:hypothetical protein
MCVSLLPSLNVFIYRATKSTLATSCQTMNFLIHWGFINLCIYSFGK